MQIPSDLHGGLHTSKLDLQTEISQKLRSGKDHYRGNPLSLSSRFFNPPGGEDVDLCWAGYWVNEEPECGGLIVSRKQKYGQNFGGENEDTLTVQSHDAGRAMQMQSLSRIIWSYSSGVYDHIDDLQVLLSPWQVMKPNASCKAWQSYFLDEIDRVTSLSEDLIAVVTCIWFILKSIHTHVSIQSKTSKLRSALSIRRWRTSRVKMPPHICHIHVHRLRVE